MCRLPRASTESVGGWDKKAKALIPVESCRQGNPGKVWCRYCI
jgi:hypothetical protein